VEGESQRIAEVANHLHDLIESRQVGAEIAIIGLISTAGEIVLGMISADPALKDPYLKTFNSAVEQVRTQLKHKLDERKI
jgi:hypothetical protein